MKTIVAIVALILLSACQPETEAQSSGLAGFDPNLIENQRQACLDSGGRFGSGATAGGFVCFQATRDANQACTASTDCEGLCLARSGTCSPVTPLFGCHEVLGKLGGRATLCIN